MFHLDENKYIKQYVLEPVFRDGIWSIKYRFTLAHKWETFSNPAENIVRAQYLALKKKLTAQYNLQKQRQR